VLNNAEPRLARPTATGAMGGPTVTAAGRRQAAMNLYFCSSAAPRAMLGQSRGVHGTQKVSDSNLLCPAVTDALAAAHHSIKPDQTPRFRGRPNFLPKLLPRSPVRGDVEGLYPLLYRVFARTGRRVASHSSKLVMRVRFPSSALIVYLLFRGMIRCFSDQSRMLAWSRARCVPDRALAPQLGTVDAIVRPSRPFPTAVAAPGTASTSETG
jgi:hypothetical protein